MEKMAAFLTQSLTTWLARIGSLGLTKSHVSSKHHIFRFKILFFSFNLVFIV